MIIDTSAVIAILTNEADSRAYATAVEAAETVRISTAAAVETSVVLIRRGVELTECSNFVRDGRVELAPFTADQLAAAVQAYQAFGAGSGSRARLNLGDCFSYALAKDVGEPLLFKGGDFRHTDIEPALK